MDRVVTFSIRPDNTTTRSEVDAIKEHCEKTGINFSLLMCKAVAKVYKELKL